MPLIVQSDRTLLLDVHSPVAEECRNALIPFAELLRSPEHLHTYALTPLSVWNAASAGFTSQDAIDVLKNFSRYEVPQNVLVWISETANRFGKLRLVPCPSGKEEYLYLVSSSPYVFKEISANPAVQKLMLPCSYEEVDAQSSKGVSVSDEEKNTALS